MRVATVRAFGLILLLLCGSALAEGQPSYDTLIQQGSAQLQAGHADLALQTGNTAQRLDGGRWEAYALTGGALMNLRRYDDAVSELTEALKRAPTDKQEGLRNLRKQCIAAESATATAPAKPASGEVTQAEIVLWKTIEKSTNPADFHAYLTQYQQGAFVVLAQQRLTDLKTAGEQHAQKEKDAQATGCPAPDSNIVIPNGAAASMDEMVATKNALHTYSDNLRIYTSCLTQKYDARIAAGGDEKQLRQEQVALNNTAVDRLKQLADQFNTQVRIFKAR